MTEAAEQATATVAPHQPTDGGGSGLVGRYHRDGYVVLREALSAPRCRPCGTRPCASAEASWALSKASSGPELMNPTRSSSAATCASTFRTSCPS